MMKGLTATALAATLAATGLAPASAEASGNTDKALLALLGVAAVYGVARELDRRKDAGTDPIQVHDPMSRPGGAVQAKGGYYYSYEGSEPRYHDDRKNPQGQSAASAFRYRVLPLSCVTSARGPNNTRHLIAQRCLDRKDYRWQLPQSCRAQVPVPEGKIPGYSADCLVQRGYFIGTTRY